MPGIVAGTTPCEKTADATVKKAGLAVVLYEQQLKSWDVISTSFVQDPDSPLAGNGA